MTKEEIATTLKLCRIKAGFEAKDVAEKLMSMGAIKSIKSFYNWESGRTQPDADMFMYLCDLYNVKEIMPTFGYGNSSASEKIETEELSEDKQRLLKNYDMLNNEGKSFLLKQSEMMANEPEYKKSADSQFSENMDA